MVPIRTFIAASAALLMLGALAACGKQADKTATGASAEASLAAKLFPDNFKGVCSGASVSAATAYDPAAKAHKALYFATYKDDLMDQSSTLPNDWTVQFDEHADAYKAVDLVICARRVADKQVKVCDGYKDKDDKPTGNMVRWHTATYEVSVREALTGKELEKKTIEAGDSTCPMFQNFDSSTEAVDDYASLSDTAVLDLLRPHMNR